MTWHLPLSTPDGAQLWGSDDYPAAADAQTPAQRRLKQEEALLGEALNGEPFAFSHAPNGAPLLQSTPPLRLSVSHSGEHLVLLLSNPHHLPGVDLERIGAKAERVRERFMDSTELQTYHALLAAHPQAARIWAHAVWTAKEAAYKIFCPADASLKNNFRLQAAPVMPARATGCPHPNLPEQSVSYLEELTAAPQFTLVCSLSEPQTVPRLIGAIPVEAAPTGRPDSYHYPAGWAITAEFNAALLKGYLLCTLTVPVCTP